MRGLGNRGGGRRGGEGEGAEDGGRERGLNGGAGKGGGAERGVSTMTLPCISSVATFWPAARSLLVMITLAPAAANTLTVSLPMPAFASISL